MDKIKGYANRYQLYIFEVVETVSAPGKLGGWRLKMRTKDPARNPVSAVAGINGYLLNSNGPKVCYTFIRFDVNAAD
jgi:cleavage and polyadenylation specificity factor subunit 1